MTMICQGTSVEFTAITANGGPAPLYEWFLNGISQGAASPNATFRTIINSNTDIVRVKLTSNASCVSPNTAEATKSIVVISPITAGSIGSDQTICFGTTPAELIEITASTGTIPIYSWESSLTGSNVWSPITGASGKTYTFPSQLIQNIFIRRIITDPSIPAPCNIATSNVIHIAVRPPLTAGVIDSDEKLCSGAAPATMNSIAAPTGGNDTYSYGWESDNGNGTFTSIAGATNASYSSPVLATTTHFRRRETSTCGSTITNVVTKTVSPPDVVSVSLTDPGQMCVGSATTFTAFVALNGTPVVSYAWSLDGVPVGTNSSIFTYIPLTNDAGKTLTVVATSSTACNAGPAVSNEVILDVVVASMPSVTISSSPISQCSGLPVHFSVVSTTGPGNTPAFQWFVKHPSGIIAEPVGTGGLMYTSTNFMHGDQVYVELTSNLPCKIGVNPFLSNIITVSVLPVPSPIINEGNQSICAGESFKFTATIGTGTRVNWIFDGTVISGATTNIHVATQAGVYTIQEDNGICGVTSRDVVLTIDPCGTFSSTINGPNPITPGQQNAVYSVPDQTGFSYNWAVTGGTIVSGQSTHAVTVDWDGTATNAFARTTIPSYAISVTETNPDGQKKTTTSTINTVATSIVQSLTQSGIKLFPNPTTESFNIEMPESGMDVSFEILDLTGLSVASGTFTSTGSDQKIAADFGAGMYQVVLKYNGIITTARLSKVK